MDADGGTVSPQTVTVIPSAAIGNRLPTPIRDGYWFDGWFDAQNRLVTAITIAPEEATTFTARWSNGVIWHSDSVAVGFWPNEIINVYIAPITQPEQGTVSTSFQWDTWAREAINTWQEALFVDIDIVSTPANAQIRMHGGDRERFERREERDFHGRHGVAFLNDEHMPVVGTVFVNGFNREIRRMVVPTDVLIFSVYSGNNWTTTEQNRIRATAIHELGHTMGWFGHSIPIVGNMSDVMWASVRDDIVVHGNRIILQENEATHLLQIYDRFR